MRLVLGITCLLIIFSAHSEPLPVLSSEQNRTFSKFYLADEPYREENRHKEISIDNGYIYAVFNDIDVYFGTGIPSSHVGISSSNENGFLSGVSYQLNSKVILSSSVQSYFSNRDGDININITAELTSRLQLSEDLDLRATLGYQEWQQGVEVGLGFRF
ncbi:hypothetical protein [Vibrio ziniensis]|uniref:Uncharacterized protein n=1 Tax=Vibrio ziniensis TaxID=2711221 RepID=A0A6G7CKK2_9VIBR|nr:hypothetical protein [Vibrio ziniensis]QIH42629.1 hypothetical protein G5S32_11800 [Vibrio ziniensis]